MANRRPGCAYLTSSAALIVALLLTCIPLLAADPLAALPRQTRGYNQAFLLGQAAWGDDSLGTSGCPDTIATTGCLVTAFSCALEYYGIEVPLPASGGRITGSDPGALNAWLKQNSGYGDCAGDAFGSCCLDWSNLPAPIRLDFYSNTSETGIDRLARERIDTALSSGQPVIAGVHWGEPCGVDPDRHEDCHWVILTARTDDTYVILDPYNPDPRSPYAVRT
ncbi:hypothetical protein JW848_10175, partial [Candidatus Bipolaricaulota bacterium]|nr:hypothetical protein [Candidatus Bipolaricaulota bacterium]